MKFLRSALAMTTALLLAVPAMLAQVPDDDLDRYINEIRPYKHDFMARELNLSGDNRREFFEVYDAMEDTLIQVNAETRALERSVINNPDATDTEIDAAITAIYSQKAREARIEEEYMRLLSQIVTPRQMLRLKATERRFNQKLVRQHRRPHRGRPAPRPTPGS